MACRNLCQRFETTDCKGRDKVRLYLQGWKRCRTCEVMIKTDGRFCQCCGYILGITPFSGAAKVALRAIAK